MHQVTQYFRSSSDYWTSTLIAIQTCAHVHVFRGCHCGIDLAECLVLLSCLTVLLRATLYTIAYLDNVEFAIEASTQLDVRNGQLKDAATSINGLTLVKIY